LLPLLHAQRDWVYVAIAVCEIGVLTTRRVGRYSPAAIEQSDSPPALRRLSEISGIIARVFCDIREELTNEDAP
jgi:hypothetical protein